MHRCSLAAGLILKAFIATALPAAGQDAVAVVGARIVDGRGGPPIENGVIVVSGGTIAAVGPSGSVRVPDGAEVIDAGGRTLLPGLADMHVHLAGGWDGETADLLGYQRYLDALLYAGVTTAMDTGGVLLMLQQIRQEIDAGRIEGPRLRFVGPVLDGPDPVWPPISYRLTSTAQAEKTAEQLAAGGVSALKAYGSLPDTVIAALVTAGARQGVPVLADVGIRNGSLEVARTGLRAFAHTAFVPLDAAAADSLAALGVGTITTLAVIESFAGRRLKDLSFLNDPLLSRTMPPWFRESLVAFAGREMDDRSAQGEQRMTAGLAVMMANVRALHDAGVLLVAGTDAPYPGVYYGEGLHRELELLVEAGLTPLEAISAATRNAAVLLGEEDAWGTLQPGLAADLVLVDGRPDRDIGDTRRIRWVMQGGRRVDRSALEFDPRRHGTFRVSHPLRPLVVDSAGGH